MSDSLMHQIETSVRGELPHLKRKLRNHHKPARLFEVCQELRILELINLSAVIPPHLIFDGLLTDSVLTM